MAYVHLVLTLLVVACFVTCTSAVALKEVDKLFNAVKADKGYSTLASLANYDAAFFTALGKNLTQRKLTIFIPNDASVPGTVPIDVLSGLLQGSSSVLYSLLQYHVLEGWHRATDFLIPGKKFKTVSNLYVTVLSVTKKTPRSPPTIMIGNSPKAPNKAAGAILLKTLYHSSQAIAIGINSLLVAAKK